MAEPLINHIENYLGRIEAGWNRSVDDVPLPFQIVRTVDGKVNGVCCYSTLGLSDFELTSPVSGKTIRHELFIAVNDMGDPRNIPGVLQSLAQECIRDRSAFVRGQVVGPRQGSVIRGAKFEALYVAMPVYWPDDFATCEVGALSIVFAWLVPITASESSIVKAHGWNRFEEALADSDLDMCDVHRTGLILDG